MNTAKSVSFRSMNMGDLIKDKVEPGYIDGHVDKEDERVSKRVRVLDKQIERGFQEMQVRKSKIHFVSTFLYHFFWNCKVAHL